VTVTPDIRRTGAEHASAVVRLAAARDEQRRLDVALAAAAGTGAEALAQERVSAGHAEVAARDEWLHWVDEGESLAPWADGEWANTAPTDPAYETGSVSHDLRRIHERIERGEADLIRAIAAAAERTPVDHV
jgi:hypothetical protein